MSIGCAVKFAVGKKRKDTLYIQLKNGAVYRHPDQMAHYQMTELVSSLQAANNRVPLRHWVKVR